MERKCRGKKKNDKMKNIVKENKQQRRKSENKQMLKH